MVSEKFNRASGPMRWHVNRLFVVTIAFATTVTSGEVHAVTIPSFPLQASGNFPAPNILVMLDDSSSMWQLCMPISCGASTPTLIRKSYVHNSLWYDPRNTYLPWAKGDGTRYLQAPSGQVWGDQAFATGAISAPFIEYFVPITEAAEIAKSSDPKDYFRYQVKEANGVKKLIRSRWTLSTEFGVGLGTQWGCPAAPPDVYAYYDCTEVSFQGRDIQQEIENYNNWYSFHRTRIKLAKAALAEAFSELDENFRIGFDSLHRVAPGHPLNGQRFDIPVGSAGGLFRGANKAAWFDRLFASAPVDTDVSTPLRSRLQRAGDYFSLTDSAGPWGPESGSEQISCRQNFTVLTTDGYWNGDAGFQIGDQDGTSGPVHQGPMGRQGGYQVNRPYHDNYVEVAGYTSRPNTLADVAMHYWKSDLRPDLVNNVPEFPSDPAFWQHMVTFGISIGATGRLNYRTDFTAIINGTKHWGDPFNTPNPDTNDGEDGDHIDDLWHAAVNSRGTFSVASNTQEFTKSLLDSLANIAARVGSGGNVTANSASLTSDTRIFQTSFTSGRWSGDLAAYHATSAGTAAAPIWTAAARIPQTGRRILTWNGTVGTSFPTPAQETLLDVSGRPGSSASGAQNAAYIAGNRALERQNGGSLRDRSVALGDIVNSSPNHVRELDIIFVGANDGMLHAFDAGSGVESFAFVPAGLDYAALSALSDPQYIHKFFVDGPVVVSSKKQTSGRNYLVGTLGRGGKGLFALDVTTPEDMPDSSVLWDRTGNNDGDIHMGQILGEPLIATLNDANRSTVVIFGNGINSASGRAVLYVVDLETGELRYRIDTGVGADNGLFAPRGWDDNADGTVDSVYAGDLQGNVWKFDFSGAEVQPSAQRLFTTPGTQPITAGLALAREPTSGRLWILLGTGSLLTTSDLTNNTIQSVYGLIDGDSTIQPADLEKRDIAVVATADGKTQRAFEAADSLPEGKRGWYLNLDNPQAGERVISRPQVRGNVLLFASVIPPAQNSCEPGGRGFINAIDVFSGTSLAEPYFDSNGDGKVDGGDVVADAGGAALSVGSVDLGVGMPTMPTLIEDLLTAGGSTASRGQVRVRSPLARPRRISWREIIGI